MPCDECKITGMNEKCFPICIRLDVKHIKAMDERRKQRILLYSLYFLICYTAYLMVKV